MWGRGGHHRRLGDDDLGFGFFEDRVSCGGVRIFADASKESSEEVADLIELGGGFSGAFGMVLREVDCYLRGAVDDVGMIQKPCSEFLKQGVNGGEFSIRNQKLSRSVSKLGQSGVPDINQATICSDERANDSPRVLSLVGNRIAREDRCRQVGSHLEGMAGVIKIPDALSSTILRIVLERRGSGGAQ
jgi:hypothetical protein